MYALQYRFTFRYQGKPTVINIPVDEYIASGREVDEWEVWEYILESYELKAQLVEQVPDFVEWMRMPDYYDKSLQRQDPSLKIVNLEGDESHA